MYQLESILQEMREPLFDDLKQHQQCEMPTMLKALLKRCLKEGEPREAIGLEELLRECLDVVAQRLRDNADANAKLLGYLQLCSENSDETTKYEPFVKFCNEFLDVLHNISIKVLRDPSPLNTRFFRNDPKRIDDKNRAQLSPDVGIMSSKNIAYAAAIASSVTTTPNRDLSATDDNEARPLKPEAETHLPFYQDGDLNRLTWDMFLSTMEGKVGSKREILFISLNTKEVREVPPQEHIDGRNLARLHSRSDTGGVVSLSSNSPPIVGGEAPHAAECKICCCTFLIFASDAHVINLIFKGTVIYLWYYDSEGSIQTYGLDFFENLPHFGVLLLALQRFTEAEWGIIPQLHGALFNPSRVLTIPCSATSNEPQTEIVIDSDKKPLRRSYALCGRQTRVYEARRKLDESGENDLVIKIYFPELARVSEVEIIEEASKWEETEPDIRGHLPRVVCHMDFPDYATDRIRRDLGLRNEERPRSTRVPRVIVFDKYQDIITAPDLRDKQRNTRAYFGLE
ncbi:hypothetical protein AX17_007087 [Amanita inopinata Kibby_2008]|nr:hypothetical protein AX17_007087 [Amanita inopinata Kibby_2008]